MPKKEKKPIEQPGPGDETDFGLTPKMNEQLKKLLEGMPEEMAKEHGRKMGMMKVAMMSKKDKK